jgi:hypothetical protein
MFCSNCGTTLPEGTAKCTSCGQSLGMDFGVPTSGAIKGFFILVVSFFTMPVKTLKITATELREIGNRGALDVKTTNIPHLTWLVAASHVLASIVIVLIILWGVVKGLMSLKDLEYDAKGALLGLVGYPLGGVLGAAVADWLIMIFIETLMLWVNIANDTKRVADK